MLNLSGNPFAQFVETSVFTSSDGQQQKKQQQKKDEHQYLKDDDADEVSFSGSNSLTEEEILEITQNYIARLKSENESNEKTIKNLDKYIHKFNVKKFMKNNPDMNYSDIKMILFNETSNLIL